MPRSITIHNQKINPGERKVIQLPMPKLYDWTPMNMPIHVIHGKKSGPTLCVTAAIHGDEISGVEITRRFLKKSALKQIKGTLIVAPIINIYGFFYQDRYLMDRRDLNRAFPGSKKGSLAARLAHLVATELISRATHCIDLHSGTLHRTNLPQIRADFQTNGIKPLARAFNAPVVLHANMRDGSLRQYADELGIPFLLYEAGESLRFDEMAIRTGVNGILNVMHKLKMIDKPAVKKIKPAFMQSSVWVRASHSGIQTHPIPLGKRVKRGQRLAVIANPTGHEEHTIRSPVNGIVIGKSNLPLVHAGAALFHIASFSEPHFEDQKFDIDEEYYMGIE